VTFTFILEKIARILFQNLRMKWTVWNKLFKS